MSIGCTSSLRFSSNLSSSQFSTSSSLHNNFQNIQFLRNNRTDNEIPSTILPDSIPTSFQGLASYYGNQFHGRMTSNGEIFDQTRFTAAHRSLPFGTFLLVTNLKNNASVVVRINDRGPFKMERVLDLSHAAAEELDMLREGVQEVTVKVIE
ncbi:MAG: septal ring lytic transglycosylase RlpA family protein [Ignavibacteria bacterium]|nr:septal ring lytic transglycosylase RlpA family protein [Ignavibacteria bacterium]